MRIPPAGLFGLALFAQQRLPRGPRPFGPGPRAMIAMGLVAAAGWLGIASLGAFRRHGTTWDPVATDRVSALVTDGPNAVTRNPMYVGLAALLAANAVRRGPLTGVLPIAFFIKAIDRWQIPAEEASLRETFGEDYVTYCRQTPRWL